MDRNGWCTLDEAMPRWSTREHHEVSLSLGPKRPAAVMDAVEALTWREVPGFYRIIRVAGMGAKRFAPDARVLDMFLFLGSPYRLVHRSEEELVIAGILPLSKGQRLPELGDHPVHSFRELTQPNLVKVSMNFLFRNGVLSTETRNLPIGWRASLMFGLYWWSIRLGSGFIRRSWLGGIRRRVEALA